MVCASISTTTTVTAEACIETFKIQKGPLNCDLAKVLYLLKCKICGKILHFGKAKTKFCNRLNNYKSKNRAFQKDNQKVAQKRLHAHYCLDGHSGIDDCDFVIIDQCEAHEKLKERDTFWQHRLKIFYQIGLNAKGGILILIIILIINYYYYYYYKYLYLFIYVYFYSRQNFPSSS